MGEAGFEFLDHPGPLAFAHQGGGAENPENSRRAIEHAVALGYRYLETDVHATRDGVVVLNHDDTLDRTTDGTGPIRERTWAELSQIHDATGEPLVRLDELLGSLPGLRVNIDAKEASVLDPLVEVLRATAAHRRVCVASFSSGRVGRLRRRLGARVATSLGQGEVIRLLAAARLPGAPGRCAGRSVPARGHDFPAACAQVPAAQFGIRVVDERFVAAAHALGLQVHVWTIDEAQQMTRLLDLGVDGLITDRPTVLREVLRARGQWPEA